MKRSRALTALLVAFIVALVTACGGGGDDTGGDSATPEKLEGTITVRFMGDPQPIYETFAKEFEQANPGTKVELQQTPWAEAHDQFVTEISGGEVVDVSEMGNTWTREFADLGGLEPLELPEGVEAVPGAVESASLDDTLYGMPWYSGARGLIYRKDIFQQAGVTEPPETWDELKAAADKIKAKFNDKPYAVGVPARDMHAFMPLIWQAGGDVVTESDGSYKAAVASPEGVEAWNFWKSLYAYSPKGSLNWNSLGSQEAFSAGQVAMIVGGGWDLLQILQANPELEPNIGTALLPEGPGGNRDTFAGGSDLVVFKDSDNIPLAKAFVEFMVEPENVGRYAENVPGFFPGTADGIKATSEKLGPMYQPFATMLLEHTRSYPLGAAWGALEGAEVFQNKMQEVLSGKTPTKEALESLAEEMDAEFGG